MQFRISMLEFGVTRLEDIRFLLKAWDRFWSLEGGIQPHSLSVYITIVDRLQGEQVSLNFQAKPEMLDRFLSILKQDGLKFTRNEIIPRFFTRCRVERDRGSED